jgi:hypothetical protein
MENNKIIEFTNVSSDCIERLGGYELYERTGYNLPEDLVENIPLKLYPVAALKLLLENPEDDTNMAVKEEIEDLYDRSAGCILFSVS